MACPFGVHINQVFNCSNSVILKEKNTEVLSKYGKAENFQEDKEAS